MKALTAALLALLMVSAACGSSKKNNNNAATNTTAAANVKQGGDLVFGAEQEADCLDWIGSCAGAAWGVYTIQTLTMPRAMDFTDKAEYKASPLLTGEPKLETSPAQKVTYNINLQFEQV